MSTLHEVSVDTRLLLEWFVSNAIPFDGAPQLQLIAGGRSNLTYRVTDSTGREYVLRRPPRGEILESAHDVAREHRIVTALAATDVPVPTSYGLCDDVAVVGAPFYVMNLVPGSVLAGDDDGRDYPTAARGPASSDLVDVLGRIHTLDVDDIGLGALGKKDGYCERQLRRWQQQLHAPGNRELPMIDELHDRLAASVPRQRHTGLVHGDYRPGNTLLSAEGRVNAVLDWELATLGDTMADVGWLLATWREPGEIDFLDSPTAHEGWSRRDALIERYASTTGRDVSEIGWYVAFALWRLSCIGEGIFIRYRNGAMGDDGFDVEAQGQQVLRLAEASRDALDALG